MFAWRYHPFFYRSLNHTNLTSLPVVPVRTWKFLLLLRLIGALTLFKLNLHTYGTVFPHVYVTYTPTIVLRGVSDNISSDQILHDLTNWLIDWFIYWLILTVWPFNSFWLLVLTWLLYILFSISFISCYYISSQIFNVFIINRISFISYYYISSQIYNVFIINVYMYIK